MKQKRVIHRMRPEAIAAVRAARDSAANGGNAITPAAVLHAEFPAVIEIAGRKFLPFRLNTLRALQAVKSPIIAAAVGSKDSKPVADIDCLIALWIFTTELDIVRETIGRGIDAVKKAAEPLGDMLDLGQQFELGKAIGLHVQSAFVTIIASAEKDPDLKKVLLAAQENAANERSASPKRPTSTPGSATASVGQATTSSGS